MLKKIKAIRDNVESKKKMKNHEKTKALWSSLVSHIPCIASSNLDRVMDFHKVSKVSVGIEMMH